MLKGTKVVPVMVNALVSTGRIVRTLMTEPDELAIKLVALDGHRMKLKGIDRKEAIRLMAQRRVPPKIMAWRLCIGYETLRRTANREEIDLKGVPIPHWTYNYYVQGGLDQEKISEYKSRRRANAKSRKKTS